MSTYSRLIIICRSDFPVLMVNFLFDNYNNSVDLR